MFLVQAISLLPNGGIFSDEVLKAAGWLVGYLLWVVCRFAHIVSSDDLIETSTSTTNGGVAICGMLSAAVLSRILIYCVFLPVATSIIASTSWLVRD